MRVLLQRVLESSVSIEGKVVGKSKHGYLLLVGFTHQDTCDDIDYLVDKIKNLRIFSDKDGNMNLSIVDVGGSILSISQFTLYADARKGRRPSFVDAMKPSVAKGMYETFNHKLEQAGLHVETGVFGADMQVSLVNDGPVTICLESRKKV